MYLLHKYWFGTDIDVSGTVPWGYIAFWCWIPKTKASIGMKQYFLVTSVFPGTSNRCQLSWWRHLSLEKHKNHCVFSICTNELPSGDSMSCNRRLSGQWKTNYSNPLQNGGIISSSQVKWRHGDFSPSKSVNSQISTERTSWLIKICVRQWPFVILHVLARCGACSQNTIHKDFLHVETFQCVLNIVQIWWNPAASPHNGMPPPPPHPKKRKFLRKGGKK